MQYKIVNKDTLKKINFDLEPTLLNLMAYNYHKDYLAVPVELYNKEVVLIDGVVVEKLPTVDEIRQKELIEQGLILFSSLPDAIQSGLRNIKEDVEKYATEGNFAKVKELIQGIATIYPQLSQAILSFLILLANSEAEKLALLKQLKVLEITEKFDQAFQKPILYKNVYFLPSWRGTYSQVYNGLLNKTDDYEICLDVITTLQPLTMGAEFFTKTEFTEIYEALFDISDEYYNKRRTYCGQANNAQSIEELDAIIISF